MPDRTGQGWALGREGRPLHQVSNSSPGPREQVGQPVDTDGHRSAVLGPLRSTKTILGRIRGAERLDPSQPRQDVWGILDRMASPISLTLSHLAPTPNGLVRKGGAFPGLKVRRSESLNVCGYLEIWKSGRPDVLAYLTPYLTRTGCQWLKQGQDRLDRRTRAARSLKLQCEPQGMVGGPPGSSLSRQLCRFAIIRRDRA